MPEPDPRQLTVVFRVAGMDQVQRERDLVYQSSPALRMDIYRPVASGADRLPAVIFVHGDGPADWLKDIKDWGQYVSWGELAAASGMVGITFNHRSTEGFTRIAEATSDIENLMDTVFKRASELGIDGDRVALWAASAGGYLGANAALTGGSIRCLVLYYALMEPVAVPSEDLARFSATAALTKEGPAILIARAGLDSPKLNERLDAFAAAAVKAGLDVELHNHAQGRHAFDVLDRGPRSSEIIARSIEFMRARTTVP